MPPFARDLPRLALIVGAQKAGTTSLFAHLARHPEIAPARIKEPFYFTQPDVRACGLDWYLGLFDGLAPGRVALEASTEYAAHPHRGDAAREISVAWPGEARFVYLVRDPVARVQSQVRHDLARGRPGLDKTGLTALQVDLSRYAHQLDRYRQAFPDNFPLVLSIDQLNRSPETVLPLVCRHLGIEPEVAFEGVDVRHNVGGRVSPLSPIWNAARRTPVLGPGLERALPPALRARIRQRIVWRGRRGRAHLTPEEKRTLLQAVDGDLVRLAREYGIDQAESWRACHRADTP